MVDMTVLGISLQEDGNVPVLLLHPMGTEQILSLRIGPLEAFAISTALHGGAQAKTPEAGGPPAFAAATGSDAELFPRPQTHDLLLNVIRATGGALVSVDILHIVDGAFIAEAVIDHPGGRARVDCRPSDGIALALRCEAAVRATSAVVAHAEDIATVMAGLPEYVRTIAAAKLAALPGAPGGGLPRLPMAIEAALAAGKDLTRSSHREVISAARKMMEEEHAGLPSVTLIPSARKADAPAPEDNARPRPLMPQIRVSLVRHKGSGQTEIMDEFQIPATGLPKDVIASLGLSRTETEAVSAASDEERWAMLLRMLSPETKVPM